MQHYFYSSPKLPKLTLPFLPLLFALITIFSLIASGQMSTAPLVPRAGSSSTPFLPSFPTLNGLFGFGETEKKEEKANGMENGDLAVANDAAEDFSSSSSSSGDDSFEKDEGEEEEEENGEEEGIFALENVADWHPPACPTGQFRSSVGNCRQCSVCGPDLYEKKPCQRDQDTRCAWCLSAEPVPLGNNNFKEKCTKLIRLRADFKRVMAGSGNARSGNGQLLPAAAGREKEGEEKGFVRKTTLAIIHFPSFRIGGNEQNREKTSSNESWWKTELAVQMAFFLSLIALGLAVVRFVYKNGCCKLCGNASSSSHLSGPSYRSVKVVSPAAVLDELQQKDIIRAAESIRQKLGAKGYERLQEEFI